MKITLFFRFDNFAQRILCTDEKITQKSFFRKEKGKKKCTKDEKGRRKVSEEDEDRRKLEEFLEPSSDLFSTRKLTEYELL